MRQSWYAVLFAAFVFAPVTATVSPALDYTANTHAALPSPSFNVSVQSAATFLLAPDHQDDSRGNSAEHRRDYDKEKHKDKGQFHGAEMNTGAVVLAGLVAISAYYFLVRRSARKRI